MKYLKKYENLFTNMFTSKYEPDIWEDYMDDTFEEKLGYNKLMSSAYDGDIKKFKYFFKFYQTKLNDISKTNKTVLIYTVLGSCNMTEKKEIIKILIDNNTDMNFEYNGKTFYELIKDDNLKKWVENTYPEFIKNLILKRSIEKYNL